MLLKLFGLISILLIPAFVSPATVNGAAQGNQATDFEARCRAKGVIRCFGFDSDQQVLGILQPAADGRFHAVVDTSMKASGAGSLRFDIMPKLGANTSGSFPLDFSKEFDSGEEFFVQWRQRFDQEMATRVFHGGEGWKQAIIGGDGRESRSARSCTPNEIVLQNSYHRGFPQIYHSCGIKDSQYEPLTPISPPSDYLLQDAVSCKYSNPKASQCFRYRPDQWMTFQIHVKIGKWYVNQSGNYHRDSTVELWTAEENKPSVLLISMPDYDLVHDGAVEKYQRIWFLPYNTNKSDSEDHPVAHTWYDEFIVSTARIPDPGVNTPNPPDSLSATATEKGVKLQWRNNSDSKTQFHIERCGGAMYDCAARQAFSEISVAPPGATSFEDEKASRTKRYTYRVRASNQAGNSAYSNPATNVPRPPSDLRAEAIGGGTVNLSWVNNSTDATEFILEGCGGKDCANFSDIAHVSHDETRYSQHGLTAGKVYKYRVRSANAAGSWITWDRAGTAYSNTAVVSAR